ncbi:MAG: ABC transporter permease, partial [Nanoarchaeota archaeon]|nr:ABC transporter permease [Nanoarchaeota archaeon]
TSLGEVSTSLSSIKSSLSQFEVSEAEVIATPLVTNIEMISSKSSNLDYVFPVLLTLVVMFLAIMLGSTLVMIEKTSQAYIRNFLVPIGKIVTVLGTLLTNLILIALQLVVILLISLFFIPNSWLSLPIIFIVMLIAAVVFTLIGMVIGYIFSSEETGILASISTGSLLLFLSGVILPVEGMSPWLREFITLNPYVVTESLVREIFIFGSPFWTVWEEIFILLFYCVILFLSIMVIDSIIRKNLLKDIMFQKHKKYRAEVAHRKESSKRRAIFKENKGNISNWGVHETKTPVKKNGLFSGLFGRKK